MTTLVERPGMHMNVQGTSHLGTPRTVFQLVVVHELVDRLQGFKNMITSSNAKVTTMSSSKGEIKNNLIDERN